MDSAPATTDTMDSSPAPIPTAMPTASAPFLDGAFDDNACDIDMRALLPSRLFADDDDQAMTGAETKKEPTSSRPFAGTPLLQLPAPLLYLPPPPIIDDDSSGGGGSNSRDSGIAAAVAAVAASSDSRGHRRPASMSSIDDGLLSVPPPAASSSSVGGPSNPRYKTEICRNFKERSRCVYGDSCQFAHGKRELRDVVRNRKYKTKLCQKYWIAGYGS